MCTSTTRARLFHQQREWLEARFISALGKFDPAEGQRWEAAQWHDEVLWARDRQTRHLLALVCVHFDPGPFDEFPGRRHATALFEFRKGHWCVEGKNLDEMRPTRPSAATNGSKKSSSPSPIRAGSAESTSRRRRRRRT